MRDILDTAGLRQRLRESLSRPQTLIALIVTCGFLVNVQQGADTNEILRDDPLVFKGIRVLTILLGGSLAIFTVVRRKIPYAVCLAGAMLPLTLYVCSCVLSIPFSAYPLLSLFKVCEVALVALVCLIGITSAAGSPSDFFHLNVKIVLLYSVVIWLESFLFPGLAWIPLQGETPLFGHALSGVFPVINANTVGLFGAVLFLAYLPRLLEPPLLRLRYTFPALLGLASVVCSYSRISLFGLAIATFCSLILLKKYALVWGILLGLLLLATSGRVRTLAIEHLARGQEDRSLDTFASHRLTMWDHVLNDYGVSLVGRGYAAGFRYDDDLTTGHAHNSVVEVYFNVGLLGVVTWLLFIAAVCRRLYRLWKTPICVDGQFIAIVGVLIFMLIKAMGSTVFVYLDASMLIMAGIVIYLVRQDAATEPDGLSAGAEQGLALSYGAAQ
jgi:O-antigen ligase